MQLGLLSLANHDATRRGHDATVIRGQIAQAVLADDLGLDSFWIAEHHACDYGGIVPANAVLAAAIASRTTNIRIGAGAAILTLHDAVELAEQWALVDCISDGRVELGMARAFLPHEFDLFGVSMDESRDRYEEAVAIIKNAWSGRDLRHDGRFRSIPAVGPLTPLPVQVPHPPMWVTAAMTEESFRWAGQQGLGLMVTPYSVGLERMRPLIEAYTSDFDTAGHSASGCRIQASYHLVLASTTEEARHLAAGPIDHYMDSFVRAASRGQFTSASYSRYATMVDAIAKLDFDGLFQRDRLVVGTPAEATDQIVDILTSSPITDLTFMVDFGLLPRESINNTIRLLASDVAPAVRDRIDSAAA